MEGSGNILLTASKSIAGIGGGFLAIITGTLLLFGNEHNFKKSGDAIAEAESVVVEMTNANVPDSDLEGKLVYGVSLTQTEDILRDELFDVTVNGIKLIRDAKYYQLVEIKHEDVERDSDGNERRITTYTYEYKWTDKPVNSSEFNNTKYRSTNWVCAKVDTMTKWADVVGWGAYKLPDFIKHKIGGDVAPVPLNLSEKRKDWWEQSVEMASSSHTASALMKAKSEYVHIDGNTIYLGTNPSTPVVGDVRIRINYIPPGRELSVIAQVKDNTLTKYVAKNGKKYYSVKNGNLSLTQMIEDDKSSNSIFAWVMRVLLTLMIITGIRFLMKPITLLFTRIPVIGGILNGGVMFISFMFGLIWSLIIIALAWLFYRPVIALIILAVVVALIMLMRMKKGRERGKSQGRIPEKIKIF